MKDLMTRISRIREYGIRQYPWDEIGKRSRACRALASDIARTMREYRESETRIEPRTDTDPNPSTKRDLFRDEEHHLYQLISELTFFEEFSDGSSAKLSNSPMMLLTGQAGSGKTHILCDLVASRFKSGFPSVLFFGEDFQGDQPFTMQLVSNLGRMGDLPIPSKLMNTLSKAGKLAGVRSLIVVDAANESPRGFWRKHLRRLVQEVKRHPHVGLVVSLRSGFETETIRQNDVREFVCEEHPEFRSVEWKAITKFFDWFDLPLPQIPLLVPEFQNPLFLLLFCKGFGARERLNQGGKTKRPKGVFRGHEGATFIFENFVKYASERIAKEFKLARGRGKHGHVIWDTIIKPVAAKMVDSDRMDRISESELNHIIRQAHDGVHVETFKLSLERNLLLTKVVRYADDGTPNGFDYRFPFQKFSDHLLVRYLLNQNLLDRKNPERVFECEGALGKLLSTTWNVGIVEAMAIQVPERLKGAELVDLARHIRDSEVAMKAFLRSIVWRNPRSFAFGSTNRNPERALAYINEHVIKDQDGVNQLFDVLVTVASVPSHPFNAELLHRYLMQQPMPRRDSVWSTYLHREYGSEGAVDRLLEWAWSANTGSYISDESLLLASTTLGWLLTTPNRFVRDRATKGLVSILDGRPDIMVRLLDSFKDVDDLYVFERLLASAYGIALRLDKNNDGLKNLAMWTYHNVFEVGNASTHVLLRDYARGIVQVALHRNAIKGIDRSKVEPPYKSTWPARIPSLKYLKERYYPDTYVRRRGDDRGYMDIWMSVLSQGDFARYVVEPMLHHWSGRKLSGDTLSKKDQVQRFLAGLTQPQLELWQELHEGGGKEIDLVIQYVSVAGNNSRDDEAHSQDTKSKGEHGGKQEAFLTSLDRKKRSYYTKVIEPFVGPFGSIRDPLDYFDTNLGQRWIFKRAIDLGWDSRLHGSFDREVNYGVIGRSEQKAERIGKKYQWIALHEFLGLVSDHFALKNEAWTDSTDHYEGPWQIWARDIDPTCLLGKSGDSARHACPQLFRSLTNRISWAKGKSDEHWLRSAAGIGRPDGIIYRRDGRNGWLLLDGYLQWTEQHPPEEERFEHPRREVWLSVRSYIVDQERAPDFVEWAKLRSFTNHWMPEATGLHEVFLGEYPWASSYPSAHPYVRRNVRQTKDEEGRRLPCSVIVTNEKYASCGERLDCSLSESAHLNLPAEWLIRRMKLSQPRYDGRFFSPDGKLFAFDSGNTCDIARNCLCVRKEPLHDFLRKRGKTLVWTLLGEKQILGDGISHKRPIGRLTVNGSYRLSERDRLVGHSTSQFERFPSN